MPSESPVVPAQTEKPQHYMYLKEFRTTQCPLFLQHKCTQHRPFTCFRWHFMNQRRRRPIRKRDGTFNYSPDVYCTKYDETTGICPDGDECPLLHRTAGDTERRYHLRYYKTGTCVYETDSKGNCVKNGPHCAFAHGAHDLRPPAYDVRELQAIEIPDKSGTSNSSGGRSLPDTPSSLEKDKILAEDPKWNDTNYVLANYKTEQCKRPPRLCRQGYACPSFHNSRDRRRSPKKHKYRSTPCPNVKHGDDWGDPAQCENGDNCSYCHTRTEQQFHPEIYKSTKCNDMVQTGYCPRDSFCAFAHVEHEITSQREVLSTNDNSLAAFVSTLLPPSSQENIVFNPEENNVLQSLQQEFNSNGNGSYILPNPIGKGRANSVPFSSSNSIPGSESFNVISPLPEPIGKGRSSSTSSSINSETGNPWNFYQKAPGSEREDTQTKLRQQLAAIDNDTTIEANEKTKRKQNLILVHAMSGGISFPPPTMSTPSSSTSNMSPLAPVFYPTADPLPATTSSNISTLVQSFYPPGDTVGSVIGHALEDLSLDDIDINSIDKDLDKDNDTNSLSSSLSAGLPSSGFGCVSSVPIGIPPGGLSRGSLGSLSQSPPSPYGSFSVGGILAATHNHSKPESEQNNSLSYLNNLNNSKYSNTSYSDVNSMSPRSGPRCPHSPLYSNSLSNSAASTEMNKLKEEVSQHKTRLEHWEQAYTQAKCACEAWKKEAEESIRKVKYAEEERQQLIKQRDEALLLAKKLQQDVDTVRSGVQVRFLQTANGLEGLGTHQLRHLQQQLNRDLKTLETLILHSHKVKCMICQEKSRSTSTKLTCNHQVLCEVCINKVMECPVCRTQVQQSGSPFHL